MSWQPQPPYLENKGKPNFWYVFYPRESFPQFAVGELVRLLDEATGF
jgi:hypothetical protein